MDSRARTVATLGVLGLVLVIGAVWGWSAVTEPFPDRAAPPVCVDRQFDRGEKISRGDVTVSVYNASNRVGLAGLTMDLLVDAGFAEGSEGNAPRKAQVERVQIWTRSPGNPAVGLVASHLGRDVPVVRRRADAPGVMVVVGDNFRDLVQGRRTVTARQPVTVCGPPTGG
jgi:hypothetical protein